jgi:hypothetical protein
MRRLGSLPSGLQRRRLPEFERAPVSRPNRHDGALPARRGRRSVERGEGGSDPLGARPASAHGRVGRWVAPALAVSVPVVGRCVRRSGVVVLPWI